MTTPFEDGDEKIVEVREVVEGHETVFYAIRDMALGYWRSVHPIDDDYAAWTRDRHLRAEYATRDDAERAMASVWAWRDETGGRSRKGAA